MGGEQAASVLATVRRDGIEARGEDWPAQEEQQFRQGIHDQYERQGHPFYATARLWDDGIIDPVTRRAVQGKLGVKPDGVWGRITVSALQRRLNSGSI